MRACGVVKSALVHHCAWFGFMRPSWGRTGFKLKTKEEEEEELASFNRCTCGSSWPGHADDDAGEESEREHRSTGVGSMGWATRATSKRASRWTDDDGSERESPMGQRANASDGYASSVEIRDGQ